MLGNYVDNKKFTKELGAWAKRVREAEARGEKPEKMPDYIAKCIFDICHNKRYSKQFIGYSDNEDMIHEMIGNALENCVRYAKNFDGDKYDNAYGYINQIAFSAYIRYIKKEKKRYIGYLQYIRETINDNEIRNILEKDNPNEIKDYDTYVEFMRHLLDIMEVDEYNYPVRKTNKKKKKTKCREMIIDTYGGVMYEDSGDS